MRRLLALALLATLAASAQASPESPIPMPTYEVPEGERGAGAVCEDVAPRWLQAAMSGEEPQFRRRHDQLEFSRAARCWDGFQRRVRFFGTSEELTEEDRGALATLAATGALGRLISQWEFYRTEAPPRRPGMRRGRR